MDVVSPDLNSILPDEIMDTEAIAMEEEPTELPTPSTQCEPEPAQVPMETEVPEIVSLCSAATPTQKTQALTTSTTTDSTLCRISSGAQLLVTSSSSPGIKPVTTATKPSSPVVSQSLPKLSVPLTLPANHQLILNKVAASPASESKSPGATVLKQEGQKLLVTGLSKTGQPVVLALPHNWSKPATSQGTGDAKAQPQQFKVVTTTARTELKPVIGVQAVSSASQLLGTSSPLQAQQVKTVQITKKPPVSTAGPMITKLIITKALNNKGLPSQAPAPPVVTGRVLTQSAPVTPPRSIAVGEAITTAAQSMTSSCSSKVAISPLKSPSKLTVVSVTSPAPSSPQKPMPLSLNVALGQQILTVQQTTTTSPAKAGTSQSSTQAMKPVQTVAVGGVSTPQFKTIIPLATPPNVQQIQVPGSRFHYVRLVTTTTGGSTAQTASPSTNTNPAIQPAKPMVMNTAAVRMSVPIVPAQTVKQVVPKPMASAAQVVTTSQTQQRLIMPATPLPQIQPNLTNLPPGTVLAPAPGSGNMGYAVLPAQYVTQLPQSAFVTLASSSGFSNPTAIQTQARLPLNGLSTSDATSRPRKPCNCTKSQCLKLYCDCFANGEFCNNCNCVNCFNNLDHESERLKAIKACLDRNPVAFKPKIGKGKEGESDRRHSKGCNCKKSGCLKNYCECYEAKIMCSSICKCVGCKNFEESPERKTLMHLADAAEVRVQQQTAAKTKLSCQISDLLTRTTPAITSGGGKLPYTFVTKEVAEATCDCLLEQAEQAELTSQPQALAERLVLEEFGRCLRRIISSAAKAKTDCPINC
ncbi:protein lin-54 homolog [Electrophorus electricus]|uniref:protein lin-54 homolog n=1 Tax=Electrophorus electricus TaxID=8005 RepID=UPI0015CFEC1C|nr:protein lin-54 homolog [Electrophorus electricus]XP_026863850.2 protein lin-54 homolog [Electrophorus electricus]XP_026863858.2 protein lin-54 homolog [Electrophorus electricus]XP_026863868.2 protein lin-54 homolog [Electrophorus electricus]XP_026863876.2 protein lin-54 homolog [Electrophorus electricus]